MWMLSTNAPTVRCQWLNYSVKTSIVIDTWVGWKLTQGSKLLRTGWCVGLSARSGSSRLIYSADKSHLPHVSSIFHHLVASNPKLSRRSRQDKRFMGTLGMACRRGSLLTWLGLVSLSQWILQIDETTGPLHLRPNASSLSNPYENDLQLSTIVHAGPLKLKLTPPKKTCGTQVLDRKCIKNNPKPGRVWAQKCGTFEVSAKWG